MNSFVKQSEPNIVAEPPFAAGGGVQTFPRFEDDPLKALDDLMAAVEALCPKWPERGTFIDGGKMLL